MRTDQEQKAIEFFQVIYGDQLQQDLSFKDGQKMRLVAIKPEGEVRVHMCHSITDAMEWGEKHRHWCNVYYQVSLLRPDATNGTRESLSQRTVLAMDFDGVDNPTDLLDVFNRHNLKYNAIIASGNGCHVYMAIEPTSDFSKVEEVQQAIADATGADPKATDATRILRMPYTFNHKNGDKKHVNIYHCYHPSTIKRKPLSKYDRFTGTMAKPATTIKDLPRVPQCIVDMLNNGSPEGQRNSDLLKIVVAMRRSGFNLSQTMKACAAWADKSSYDEPKLEYQVKYIFDNQRYAPPDCAGCKHKPECSHMILSDFEIAEKSVTMAEKTTKSLKASNRKGVKVMKPNYILIYAILKSHDDGLTRSELAEVLTYKNRQCISNRTLIQTLKNMEEDGFIASHGYPKIYQLTELPQQAKDIDKTYDVNYAIVAECIKGRISREELKLYVLMRHLHNQEQNNNPKALKGNLFHVTQADLAKAMGLTQQRISQMIGNLLQEKILDVWYRQSHDNGWQYLIYRLMY